MFSRVLTTTAKTSGTLLVGALIDRGAAYKSIPALPITTSCFKTGDQRLADAAGPRPQAGASDPAPYEKHKKTL